MQTSVYNLSYWARKRKARGIKSRSKFYHELLYVKEKDQHAIGFSPFTLLYMVQLRVPEIKNVVTAVQVEQTVFPI
jgi:hypothetical protein